MRFYLTSVLFALLMGCLCVLLLPHPHAHAGVAVLGLS